MDANKLKMLRDVSYEVRPTCADCANAKIPRGGDFGTCTLYVYEHLKHTEERRELSIYRSGWCPAFAWRPISVQRIDKFMEFAPKDPTSPIIEGSN